MPRTDEGVVVVAHTGPQIGNHNGPDEAQAVRTVTAEVYMHAIHLRVWGVQTSEAGYLRERAPKLRNEQAVPLVWTH